MPDSGPRTPSSVPNSEAVDAEYKACCHENATTYEARNRAMECRERDSISQKLTQEATSLFS